MQGYDIQGQGLRLGQLRGGTLGLSRVQAIGASIGLFSGLTVVAVQNLTGWPVLLWAIVPALVGGALGMQVLGVALVAHGAHLLRYLITHRRTAGDDREGDPHLLHDGVTIGTALLDGERVLWQLDVSAYGERR